MSQPITLTEAIGKPLKLMSFKRKSDTWHLNGDETVRVLNLQKSSYGPQYYINIGVWLNYLGQAELPKVSKCHIQFRWESLIPQDEKRLERLLDLAEKSLSDHDRAFEISNLLEAYVLPFFCIAETLNSLRTLYKSDRWPVSLVSVKAQEILKDGT